MRFLYPHLPAEFEIPDDWWEEAGMPGFVARGPAYMCADPAAELIQLGEIEPPFRQMAHPKDFRGFDRARLVQILASFVAADAIPAVPLARLTAFEFPPSPFRYRVRDGLHRFHASVATGYTGLPGLVGGNAS